MKTGSKIVITAIIALAVGVAVGVGAAEHETGPAKNGNTPGNPGSSATLANANAAGQVSDPFQQIRDMQMQMDKMFSQMSAEFRLEPQFQNVVENPAYSLSLNVEDLKDRFVVRAFLPDTKLSDANVKLNNRTLTVDVSNQQTETSGKQGPVTNVAEWGQYEQTIQLPAPVKAGQMKITRQDHELVITVPKA